MIDPDQLTRMRSVAVAIDQDMEADVKRWEGSLLTGRAVGEQFGEVRAAVQALARMIGRLLEEVENS